MPRTRAPSTPEPLHQTPGCGPAAAIYRLSSPVLAQYLPLKMIDLAATFEEHATEAAAMVWRVKRTPVALRDVVALATSKAQGIVLTEPEFLPVPLVDGLRGLAGVIPKPHDDELASADVGITE